MFKKYILGHKNSHYWTFLLLKPSHLLPSVGFLFTMKVVTLHQLLSPIPFMNLVSFWLHIVWFKTFKIYSLLLGEQRTWHLDSDSVHDVPSDILVESETESHPRFYPPPMAEFNNMSLLDTQNPGALDPESASPYVYNSGHIYNGGYVPVSDTGSQGSRKSFYGGCGYSRDYFRYF